jgi:hypothetical protein
VFEVVKTCSMFFSWCTCSLYSMPSGHGPHLSRTAMDEGLESRPLLLLKQHILIDSYHVNHIESHEGYKLCQITTCKRASY